MKHINEEHDHEENDSVPENSFSDRVDSALALLPDSIRPLAESGVEWVREHPVEAVMLGTAGGFTVGILGIARVMGASRVLRSVPALLPGIIAGVTTLAAAFEAKKDDERITH